MNKRANNVNDFTIDKKISECYNLRKFDNRGRFNDKRFFEDFYGSN